MGTSNFFSRASRRWRRAPEQDPLLPGVLPRNQLPPPQSRLDKIVDVFGAVNAGKLPSQDQLARVLQLFLKFLRNEQNGPVWVHSAPLSERGRKIVEDIREIAEAMLQIGIELNHDDKLQDMLFRAASIRDNPLHIDEVALAINREGVSRTQQEKSTPSTTEELKTDIESLAKSVKTLFCLLVTSAAFRMILSDLLFTIRETMKDLATDIGCVAFQVQVGAQNVVDAATLDDATLEGLKGKAKEAVVGVENVGERIADRWATLDPAQRVRNTVIGRIQEVIHRAHRNPKYCSSLYTMLLLLRKYVEKLRSTATVVQANDIDINLVVSIDQDANLALSDFKILLERASGTSLDPFLRSLAATTIDIVTAPMETGRELQDYFAGLGSWLDCALSQTEYVTSATGARAAEHLYDSGRSLLSSSNAQWTQDILRLMNHLDEFMTALKSDRTTFRFVHALDTFSTDFRQFGQHLVASGVSSSKLWREEMWKDTIGWFIPKLLAFLRAVPIPRLEFKNNMLDIIVDSLWLRAVSESASLVPDNVWVQHWSEVRLDIFDHHSGANDTRSNTGGRGTVQSSSRIRIHVDGVRISARDIGYYFKYKGFLGYNDKGLLGVSVGGLSSIGEGLSADIDLETTTKSRQASSNEPFFRVQSVKVNVPGLTFSINRSKHWVLNKLIVQRLLGPVVKRILARELEGRIRRGLEAVAQIFTEVVEKADGQSRLRKEGSTFEDYCGAFQEKTLSFFSKLSSGIEVPNPRVQADTTATIKGLVHTTVTQPESNTYPRTPVETVIAVGCGAQIFPNEGGPYDKAQPNLVVDMVSGVVDEFVGEVHEVADALKGRVVKMTEDIAGAEGRKEERARIERSCRGWRSDVFDLGD